MSDHTRADEGEGREPGQNAYEARFADARPREMVPWADQPDEVKAVWVRVEEASAARAEADAARWASEYADAMDARLADAVLIDRLHIAFLVLSESGQGGGMYEVRRWFNSGTAKPIPWPGGACFEAWAAEHSIFDCNGAMGFRRRDGAHGGSDDGR